jgi:OPT family oligopeptide transporter
MTQPTSTKDTGFQPLVPDNSTMTEFTARALVLGLIMCVILGAANAYLGLRAGMTIAATYPAAVIGMAVLRLFKGSVLEENFARTVGSIGESVAAGAIFTIPAFVMLGFWHFDREHMLQEYLLSAALMALGGALGIMFVTILRRVMVEDPGLLFPESVAASEIHKAGQKGAEAAKQLFRAMGVGALIKFLDAFGVFRASNDFAVGVGRLRESFVKLGLTDTSTKITAGGVTTFSAPAVTPAYLGVGYIIGPQLGALNFAGGLLAWGLFVPLLVFFLGPHLIDAYVASATAAATAAAAEAARLAKPFTMPTAAQILDGSWAAMVTHIWKFIVRPIAVGGMLVGASYTLYRMRQNLIAGIRRSIADVKKSAAAAAATKRTERDLSLRVVGLGIVTIAILMTALYLYFTHAIGAAVVAMIVMLVTGFFFAAVSGNLVGMIGSSNNPLSGLTLATTVVAALTMVIIGVKGMEGVMAVLGVAAIGCVSAAVAGEMLQDLKVGHILGGTPWKMQVGDLIGVIAASLVMFFPLYLMHTSDLARFGELGGFGGKTYTAPQAGLMAALSQGIVGGEMAWPLVFVGIAMGFSLILIKVRSPMLFSVGMYLPLETTFAIFCGGVVRGIVDKIRDKRGHNAAQKARVENAGILAASGFIAGEAFVGLLVAAVIYARASNEFWHWKNLFASTSFESVVAWLAIPVALFIAWYLIAVPLRKAGAADEPAPPTAVM